MNLGDIVLKLSTVLTVAAWVAAFRWARGNETAERTFRWAYHALTACLVVASVVLMRAFLTHDFRFEYVAGYSSTDMPLLYQISGFWAGQQGTFLLWALLAALVGYALIGRRSWEPASVMALYLPTIGFLQVLMLDRGGNPFRMFEAAPLDGQGLNPLLQDPWMASHPPIVFLGYVAATVPAVLAMVALARRNEDRWVGPALRWSLTAFVCLGAGIVLGGFWAYKVLGWGGYWGWDPVENASLVPWLTVTALIHGLIVQRSTGALPRTNLTLALASYLLVVYSTFLTRSGVLADFSVHSFGESSIYRILAGGLLVILGGSAWGLLRRRTVEARSVETGLAWPFVLSVVVLLFAVSAAFVLIGTSWPILSSLFGQPSAPKGGFYNMVNLPLYVGLLALLAVGPFLAWVRVPRQVWIGKATLSVAVGACGTTVAVALGARGFGALALFLVGLAALTANLLRFVQVSRNRPLGSGAALAHVGFALMFLGIVGSSAWGTSAEATLPFGEPVSAMGHTFVFKGHVPDSGPQDRWRVTVVQPDGAEREAEVTMFGWVANGKQNELRRPAIVRTLRSDLYIAPAGLQWDPTSTRLLQLGRDEAVGYGGASLTFRRFDTSGMETGESMRVAAIVDVQRDGSVETLALPLQAHGREFHGVPVESTMLAGVTLTLDRISVEQGLVRIRVSDPRGGPSGLLAVEVSTKPLINLLWLGTLLLGVGCCVAVVRRIVDERRLAAAGREATRTDARQETARRKAS